MNFVTPFRSLRQWSALFFFVCFVAQGWGAGAPADAQIKAALDDIQKFETQFPVGANVNPANASRTLKLLALTRQRLDSSPNRSHASWHEASTRLDALINRLKSGGTPTSSATTAPATPAPAGAPRAGSGSTMISQDRVRLQKLARDIASAADTLDHGGVKPFQASDYVEEQLTIAASFRNRLDGYADFANDAEVVAARDALERFDGMITFGRQEAAKQTGAIGDVQAALRAFDQQRGRPPEAPRPPYDAATVRTWLDDLAQIRAASHAALEKLAAIRETAHLPIAPGTVEQGSPYDRQDVERLEWAYRSNLTGADQALAQLAANLDAQVGATAGLLVFLDNLDPQDTSHQINNFVGEGADARVRQLIDEAQQLAALAVEFSRQLQRPELSAHEAALARIEQARTSYEEKHARARELVRMPRAVSTDGGLLAIARETLQNPDYEIGAIRRLVINADLQKHESKTSETQFDKVETFAGNITLSGTETTYTYIWEQFQVATVEPMGDAFYIYFNTLKRFTSGGPNTPLNRWLVGERIQGSEIAAANIDKD